MGWKGAQVGEREREKSSTTWLCKIFDEIWIGSLQGLGWAKLAWASPVLHGGL